MTHGFSCLLDILRFNGVQSAASSIAKKTRIIEQATKQAEEKGDEMRLKLMRCQMEIQNSIAIFFQSSGKLVIEALDEIPNEIKQNLKYRDLLHSNQAKELRAVLHSLLSSTNSGKTSAEEAGISTANSMQTLLDKMIERNRSLDLALESAAACVEAYNSNHFSSASTSDTELACGAIGSQAASTTISRWEQEDLESNIATVLAAYDRWIDTYLNDTCADISDKAILKLKTALADNQFLASVFSSHKDQCQGETLEEVFKMAGTAIAEEYAHQEENALDFFPSTALVRVGRQLLEAWQSESSAMQCAVKVSQMLEAAVEMSEKSLGCSGLLSKEKIRLIDEIKQARERHKTSVGILGMAMLLQGNDALAQAMGITTVPDVINSRRSVRESAAYLTEIILHLTGEIQQHFPEVILFLGKGLPPAVGEIWRPAQTLDLFEEKVLLASNSRHPVWKVREADQWFAIKEFRIADAKDLQTCLKEAAIIHNLRHQAIVEIRAIFQDTRNTGNVFYIQMPWYDHGTLDQWVVSNQRPEWHKVRGVLLDALLGLTHLHLSGIIHGDVKPPNILVDSKERGRLADFDISIDTKQRTTAAWITKTVQGFTPGFQAPELISMGHASKATDIFAFGKTVQCVASFCEPPEDVELRVALALSLGRSEGGVAKEGMKALGQTVQVIEVLMSQNPEDRPSAEDAANHPFFTALRNVCKKETKTCMFCEQNGEDGLKESELGIECSEGHFHCCDCIVKLVTDSLEVVNKGKRELRDCRIMCWKFPSECRAAGFQDRDLAKHLSVSMFEAYLSARMEILQKKMEFEMEEKMKQQLSEQLEVLVAMSEKEREISLARRYIEEEILQMRCPRPACRKAFYDFDGCFAISCSSCPCKFCGWCLKDCGDDAHPHCRACPKVPNGVDALFPKMPDARGAFDYSHKMRCKNKITKYLKTLSPATQEGVRKTLEMQLTELDIK